MFFGDAERLKPLFWSCGRAENLVLKLRKGSKYDFGVAEGLKTWFWRCDRAQNMISEMRKCWKPCFGGAEGLKTWFWRCGRAKNIVWRCGRAENLVLKVRKGWKPDFGDAVGLKTWFWRCGRAEDLVLEGFLCQHTAPYGVKNGHMLFRPEMVVKSSKIVSEESYHKKQHILGKNIFFWNFRKFFFFA